MYNIFNKFSKKISFSFIILLVSCLLLASCTNTPKVTEEEKTSTTKNSTQMTDSTNTENSSDVDDSAYASLVSLRQVMIETPQIFAVAYFGYNQEESSDPIQFIKEKSPLLCEDLPFLLDIPKKNIIGTCGEVFCIVPLDGSATVAVNKGTWNNESDTYEYTDVIYRSESGDPILLQCNNSEGEPDTQITITNSDGTVTVWNPALDSNKHITPLSNEDGEILFYDFSHYN